MSPPSPQCHHSALGNLTPPQVCFLGEGFWGVVAEALGRREKGDPLQQGASQLNPEIICQGRVPLAEPQNELTRDNSLCSTQIFSHSREISPGEP